jgi:hypothetical protein
MLAAKGGDVESVRELIRQGAKVDACGEQGSTLRCRPRWRGRGRSSRAVGGSRSA